MTRLFTIFLLLTGVVSVKGQTFSTYLLRMVSPGCGPETNSNYRPDLVAGLPPCVGYSGLSRVNVSCSSAANSGDHYSSQGFLPSLQKQDAIDASTYITWSFTTQSDVRLTLTETALRIERTNTPAAGPRSAALYYTLDGGTTLIQIGSDFSVQNSDQQLFFSLTSIVVDPSSEIEFRLYAWDEPDSGPIERDIRVKGASPDQTYMRSTGISGNYELLAEPNFDNFNLTYCGNQNIDVFLPTTSQNGISGTWLPQSAFTPIQLAPGQYTFTFTPASGQCAPTTQLTVNITDPASLNWSNPPATQYCSSDDQVILLPTSIDGSSGTWSLPEFNPSTLSPGLYSSTFTAIEGFCFIPLVFNFEITESATPQFTLPTTYCVLDSDEVVMPTSDGNISGTWVPSQFTPSDLGAGESTFIFSPQAGTCASSIQVTIEITSTEDPLFNISDQYCQLSEEFITLPTISDNSITGLWTPSGFMPSSLPAGNNSFTFTPATGLCASSINLEVNILPIEEPEFDFPLIYCAIDGSTITLPTASSNGILGTWTPTSFIPANHPDGLLIVFNPAADACANPIEYTISIDTEITPIFDLPSSLCGADDTPFSLPTISSNAVSGTWVPANIIPNQLPPGMATFQFTPTLGSQCVVGTVADILITEPVTPVFDSFDNLCGADETIFSFPDQSNNMIPGTWIPATINPSMTSAGVVAASFIPSSAFCAVEIQTSILIEAPITPIFNLPSNFCQLDTEPFLLPPSTNNVQGVWTPISFVPADFQNGVSATFVPDANLCATTFETFLPIQDPLVPQFNIDLLYCTSLDQLIQLPIISDNQPTAIQGSWSIPSFNPAVQTNPSINTIFTPTPGTCATNTELDIQFETLTVALPGTVDICAGEDWTITAEITGSPQTTIWTLPNGQNSTQNSLVISQVNIDNSGLYCFEAAGAVCIAQACTMLQVLPNPSITIISTSCDEDTYTVEFVTTSGDQLEFTLGTLIQIDPSTFLLQEIPNGQSVQITLTSTINLVDCSASIDVNPPDCDCPTPAFINNMSLSTLSTCEGQTINATVTLGGSATGGEWSAQPSNLVMINNPFDLNTTITTLSEGTVLLTFTTNDPDEDDPACEAASSTLQLNISPIPAPPSGSGFVEICQGSGPYTIQLTGQNLRWFDSNFQFIGNQPPVIDTEIPGEYNFSATQTIGNCESIFRQVSVVVIERPNPPMGASFIEYCQGATALPLEANGNVLIWRNSDFTVLPGAPTPNTAALGNQVFLVSNLVNGCESLPLTITVQIVSCDCEDPIVIATFDLTPSVGCAGDSAICQVVISGIVTTGTWSCEPDNAGVFDDVRSLTTIFRPNIEGNIRITFTSDDPPADHPECIAVARSGVISRSQRPDAPSATSPQFFCFGAALDTIEIEGDSLTWFDAEGTLLGSAPNLDFTLPGSTLFNVTQTINNCESAPLPLELIVREEVGLPVGMFEYQICQGDPFDGWDIQGDSLIWYSFDGSILSSVPTISTAVLGTQRFFVANSINNCLSNRQLITIAVLDCDCLDPIINLGITVPRDSFCFGELIELRITLEGPVQSGRWQANPPGEGDFLDPFSLTPSFIPSSSGWYTFIFVSDDPPGEDCEAISDSVRVWVRSLLSPPVLLSATTYCLDSLITPLTATGDNLVWLDAMNNILPAPPTPDNSRLGEQIYRVINTDGDCQSDTVLITIQIQDCGIDCEEELDWTIWSISQDTICLGAQVQLNAQLNQPTSGPSWRSIPASAGVFTTTSSVITQFRPTLSGPILLIFDSGIPLQAGCEPKSDTFHLTVRPTPSPPGLAPDSLSFCFGEPFPSLSLSGQSICWFDDQFNLLGEGIFRPTIDRPGTYSYFINQTIAQCTSAYSVLQVTVHDLPTMELQQDTTIDCATGLLEVGGLNVETPNRVYVWQTSLGQILQTGTSDRIVLDEAGSYILTVRDLQTGCAAIDTIVVTAEDSLDIALLTDTILMLPGERIIYDINQLIGMSGGILAEVYINGQVEGTFNGLQFRIIGGSTGEVELFLPTEQSADILLTFNLLIERGICSFIGEGMLVIRPVTAPIAEGMPNVIFPEAGGLNSTLRFSTADIEEDSSLEIFNRWGQRMFKASPYRNDWAAQGLPAGVYFYVWRKGDQLFKQHVTVMK